MHRTLFILLFGLIITAMPATSFAQSEDAPIAGAGAVYCPQLSQTMVRGARDRTTVPPGQVTELQKFISDYYDIDPDDIVTGYFGTLTHRNVVRFQQEQGLPAFGIVGPLTRAAIAHTCGNGLSNPPEPAIPLSCTFNGQTIADGASVVAYQASSVPVGGACISERRYCIFGFLTGSYAHATCAPQPESMSLLPIISFSANPASIAPGQRTTLTWSATNATWCSAGGGWNGTKATSGTEATATLWAATTFTLTCFGPGGLTPVTKSATVAVIPEEPPQKRSCIQDGITLAHGASRTFYSTRAANSAGSCTAASELRTCTDGTLSGSFSYASCTPNPGDSLFQGCTFNGQTIADGASVVAYQASSVPVGGACISERRYCVSGFLTGSYAYATCAPQPESMSLLPVISFSANPASVAPGKQTTLTWSATNASWCSAGGGWSGTKAVSGTEATATLWAATTFTLTCFGPGGLTPVTKSVTVTVDNLSNPPEPGCAIGDNGCSLNLTPAVSFSANPASIAPGQRATLTWSATNASWCSAGGGWSGTKAVSGTEATATLWAATTFTLTCFGPGGLTPVTKSITVSVVPEEPAQPTFSALPTSGFAPLSVTFTVGNLTNETARLFTISYGDGTSGTIDGTGCTTNSLGCGSTVQNTHTYTANGTYTATLLSRSCYFGFQGCSDTILGTVTIAVNSATY